MPAAATPGGALPDAALGVLEPGAQVRFVGGGRFAGAQEWADGDALLVGDVGRFEGTVDGGWAVCQFERCRVRLRAADIELAGPPYRPAPGTRVLGWWREPVEGWFEGMIMQLAGDDDGGAEGAGPPPAPNVFWTADGETSLGFRGLLRPHPDHVGEVQRAKHFRPSQRVMVRHPALPEEDAWLPAVVLELDHNPAGAPEGFTLPYVVRVFSDPAAGFEGGPAAVERDNPATIRPELCFAEGLAGWATLGAAAKRGRPRRPRFCIGDPVACRVDAALDGSGEAVRWAEGEVEGVGHAFCEGRSAMYRIRLADQEGGGTVYAARDEHWLVRPLREQPPGPSTVATPSRFGIFQDDASRTGWTWRDHCSGRTGPCAGPGGHPGNDSPSDAD